MIVSDSHYVKIENNRRRAPTLQKSCYDMETTLGGAGIVSTA